MKSGRRYRRPALQTFPNFALESRVRQLPVLEQCESDGPSRIGFQDIVTGNVTGAGAGPVLFRSVPAHEVLHRELNRDVLEVIVDRRVARVVAERQIEGVPGRLDIAPIADRAGEGATRYSTARGQALEVDIGRNGPCVIVMRDVISPAAPGSSFWAGFPRHSGQYHPPPECSDGKGR